MAGFFYVLWGQKDRTFKKPEALADAKGTPLEIAGDNVVAKICTRPAAGDLNGDGKVTRNEFTGPAADFEAKDRNNDGVIDANDKPDAKK